jgi:signal transduction histidine kinase
MVRNTTERKHAEAQLAAAHLQLLEASRQAGASEVATSVLHNVGNALNSVNVSAALMMSHNTKSRIPFVAEVAALLNEHAQDLGEFLTADPKGKLLPRYLGQLAEQLAKERQAASTELELLCKNVEHIAQIVALQQVYGKISGLTEIIDASVLVEDALRLEAGSPAGRDVELVRDYADVFPVVVDKHKVLQILVNLLRNARHACDDSGRKDKQLRIQIARADNAVRIAIIDNGIGIPPEHLTRIFNYGFTTRQGGNGFGLHSGALAAKELGGSLTAHSEGPDRGATFTLELPSQAPKSARQLD